MTPGIFNSQEIKGDFNQKTLNFNISNYQLLVTFRFQKITIRCIALFTFRTADLFILIIFILNNSKNIYIKQTV